jgi:anaerobic magnesium-protoporphyrin IX monomethyl ester cyclase
MPLRFVFLQKDPIPNLATMCLSGALKQEGHAAFVLIDPAERDIVRACRRLDPDVVCFSATTGNHLWQLKTARAIKRRWDPVVLMGGPHPTFYPKVLEEDCLDYVCMGEGEGCIVDLARALEGRGEIADIGNLGWRDEDGVPVYNPLRPLIQDWSPWPFPDRAIYDHYDFVRKRRTVSVMATRGCPFRCTFCFNVSLQEMYRGKGRYVRSKPVERMIAELKDVKQRYPQVRQVGFADDIFAVDYKGWGREFLARYAEEIALPFTCLLRPDLVTPELVRSLAEANCRVVKIGLETGQEDLRVGVLKKGKLDNPGMRRAGRLLKDAGIQLYTFNIIGIPGETIDMAWETARLNIEMGTDFAWTALCQPYPGTHLEDWSVEHGFLDPDRSEDDFQYTYFVDTPLALEHKRELTNFQKLLPLVVTWPRLEPVIRRAVRLPPNPVFDLAFRAHYALGLVRTGQIDWLDVLRLAPLTADYWRRGDDERPKDR